MQKPELFELVLLSVLDDRLALAAISTLIAFELKKMVYCVAFDCNNDSRYTTDISYLCFPKYEAPRSKWLAKISRVDLVVPKKL